MPANRLIHEKSPYLLQHAHNPVDWFPWGPEAFARARDEDKPVFLSVGYSTCHWCHVMERESFENEAVARVLNQHFISIKVDREERPDIDRIYMMFVQASTGSGGWPMSVWLTPDAKPFFGGTYFPPDTRYGRPGFVAVLESLARAWHSDRARVEQSGFQVLEQLRLYAGGATAPGALSRQDLDSAYFAFRRSFDSRLGGFGGAPKFPRPSVNNFLFRYWAETKNDEARDMVLETLRAMARGGMHDQLGGGFHRYSVDERWFVPHFEKMLYDQAQLAVSYLEAYQISKDESFANVARDIFTYVLRDLSHPEGGFYSAEDADSILDSANPHEKGEGAFYVWTAQELRDALGDDYYPAFARRFGVRESGNVDEDPHGEFLGKNILFQANPEEHVSPQAIRKLLDLRSSRPRPHLDDKVLTGWNGLMISAFAKGAQILDDARYLEAAKRSADFLRGHLWSGGTLLRRFRDSDARVPAFLDDYALLANALIDLYETAFDPAYLTWAVELAEKSLGLFEDREQGGFFSTAEGQQDLVLRLKDDYDGAEPSGNSVMILALLRLGRMKDRQDFREAAERALRAFAERMRQQGSGLPQMLAAQMFAEAKPMEIVLAGSVDDAQFVELAGVVRKHFLPNAVILRSPEAPGNMPPVKGQPAAYVCENFTCNLPVSTSAELDRLLS